jgi:hypothetical protein
MTAWGWALVGVALYALVLAFLLSLCRAAAIGDEEMRRSLTENPTERSQ